MSKFTQYTPTSGPGSGDVVGPASSTDNDIAVFDGVTGKLIKDGGVTLPTTDGQLIIGDTGTDPSLGTITPPAAGVTVTNGAGTITIGLADDLAAVEGLATTGLATRTAADTWTTRSVAAGTGISVANGDGVAANPTVSVDGTVVTASSAITDNRVVRGDGGARGVQETTISVTDAGEMTNASQPSFLAEASAQANVTGDGTNYTVVFDTEIFDQNADFDGTSTFTAPVTGKYCFCVEIQLDNVAAGHTTCNMDLITSNRTWRFVSVNPGAVQQSGFWAFNGAMFTEMEAADTAVVQIKISGSTKTVDVVAGFTKFSGFLVC